MHAPVAADVRGKQDLLTDADTDASDHSPFAYNTAFEIPTRTHTHKQAQAVVAQAQVL